MKTISRLVKSCVLYLVFIFFGMMFVSALCKTADHFRFRNGDPATPEQRDIAIFVLFLLLIVSGYGAFKRAQLDWKLWKRKWHKKCDGKS
jgi:hypothetical protein